MVRLPGAASAGAIALDAHHDGASTGPGASDCGACVATLLETLRALRAGPPLRNDVIVVFAGAEENGDVRLALNFEGYATGGPSVLFATSRQNGWLIDRATLPRTPDAVFFNVLPGVVARYPQPLALPLAVVVAALFLSMLVAGFRRRRLTAGGLVVGSLAFLVGAIGVFALVTATWMAIKALNPNYQVMLVGTYQGPLFLAAFVVLAFGGMAALYAWLRARPPGEPGGGRAADLGGADAPNGGGRAWRELPVHLAAAVRADWAGLDAHERPGHPFVVVGRGAGPGGRSRRSAGHAGRDQPAVPHDDPA